MAKIGKYRIQEYAKINNITDEEAKRQLADQGEYYEEEEQLSDIQNAVDDREGSLFALQTQADMMKQGVGVGEGLNATSIDVPAENYELKGINLSVAKHNDKAKFSYKLSGNKLTITAENCTINLNEITNKNLQIIVKGKYLTLNSNATAKSIENNADNSIINGSSGKDNITNKGKNVIIHAGDGDDTIKSTGKESVIFAGSGNDNITSSGQNSTIDAGDGNDTIKSTGKESIIFAGSGNDTITSSGQNSTINAGDGNDTITNKGSYSTVEAGAGDDSITNTGKETVVFAGDDDDTITNKGGLFNCWSWNWWWFYN